MVKFDLLVGVEDECRHQLNKLQIENYFCSTVSVIIHPIALRCECGTKITISSPSFDRSSLASRTIFSDRRLLKCARCQVKWMFGTISKSERTSQPSPERFVYTYQLRLRERRRWRHITFSTPVFTRTFSTICASRTWGS